MGAVIASVDVAWPGSIAHPAPEEFARLVVGRGISAVERRGKWIHVILSGGQSLLVHLRMTGRLLLTDGDCEDRLHTRLSLLLSDGRRMCFQDVRKFGRCWLTDNADEVLGDLGPEPLDGLLTSSEFATMLSKRRGRIKPLLLNQRFLAGLGNIYADEVLFRARVAPDRPAGSLDRAEVTRLRAAIRPVLEAGLRAGGTSLDDLAYLLPDGRAGDYLRRLRVYGREDRPCRRCGTPIRRAVLRQRSTFWCPECQR